VAETFSFVPFLHIRLETFSCLPFSARGHDLPSKAGGDDSRSGIGEASGGL
jgi:hypothetical protein